MQMSDLWRVKALIIIVILTVYLFDCTWFLPHSWPCLHQVRFLSASFIDNWICRLLGSNPFLFWLQWLETRPNRQVCPVCKAGISRDKVIPLYGRGSTGQQDPRWVFTMSNKRRELYRVHSTNVLLLGFQRENSSQTTRPETRAWKSWRKCTYYWFKNMSSCKISATEWNTSCVYSCLTIRHASSVVRFACTALQHLRPGCASRMWWNYYMGKAVSVMPVCK